MLILRESELNHADYVTGLNVDKIIAELKKKNSLDKTIKTLEEVKQISSELPGKGSIRKYSKDDGYSLIFINKKGLQDFSGIEHVGGTVGLLTDAYKVIEELKLELNKLIQEQQVIHFPKFGEWDNEITPKFFILKRGLLTVLAFYFEYDLFPHFKTKTKAYEFLQRIFKKNKREEFSFSNISKLEMKIRNKDLKKLLEKYDIDDDDCFDFIHYCLEYFQEP